MPRLKRLSGDDVVGLFAAWGFEIAAQRGSHVKLRRFLPDGSRQTLTVPRHAELDKGTLRAIYRQALRYIPERQLREQFYGE